MNLKNNFLMKAFSLLLSLTLWVFLTLDMNPKIERTVLGQELNVIKPEDNNLYSEIKEKKIDFTIKGSRKDVFSINRSDIVVSVDLEKYGEGDHIVDVDVEKNSKIDKVKLDYNPKKVNVRIGKKVSEVRKIEIRERGILDSRIDKKKLKYNLKEVKIKGAKNKLESVDKVYCEVDLAQIKESKNIVFPIKAVNKSGKEVKGVKLNQDKLVVSVGQINKKEVKISPKIVGNISEGYNIKNILVDPNKVAIRNINSNKDIISDIEELKLSEINVEGLNKTNKFIANLILPEGIEIVGEKVISVVVEIEKKLDENEEREEDQTSQNNETNEENETRQNQEEDQIENNQNQTSQNNENRTKTETIEVPISSLALNNIKEGLVANVLTQSKVSVTVSGTSTEIKTLRNELKLGLDLSHISEVGDYTVEIKRLNATDNATIKINPETISIRVTKKDI